MVTSVGAYKLMLLLTATTDKVQLITSAVCDLDVIVSYVNRDTTSFAVEGAASQYTTITTATTTDICATPAAGKVRNVKMINVRNVAATAVDITFQVDVSAVDYELYKVTLTGGQTCQYIDDAGFSIVAANAFLNRTFRVATSDYVNATVSFTDITGLTCPLLSGVFYNFEAYLVHISNAATNGARFAYNIGAAPTTSIISTIDTVVASVSASTHSAGTVTARDTAVTLQVDGSVAQSLAIITGMIQPSADGTFAMRGAAETAIAAALTVKIGSWLRIWQPTE